MSAPEAGLRLWTRAFAVASLIHIALPDFQQDGWVFPALLEGAGALILLVRPSLVGFGLSAVGTLWPLLFLRDVLTQSTLLTAWATLGFIGLAVRAESQTVLTCVRATVGGTYLLAALHKMNSAFLDPAYSCAGHAFRQVEVHWYLPSLTILDPALPYLAIGLEIVLATAVLRRSRWMWPLGLLFHVPLTVTLAPAFGPVMWAGYVAAMAPRTLVRWRRVGWRWAVFGAVLGVLVELGLHQGLDGPLVAIKMAAAGALLMVAARAWANDRTWSPLKPIGWFVLGLWMVHGLTPYLGLQYQHTGAMLSNLRVDEGCWNSLVIPELVRGADPYIRIDEASIAGGKRAKREQVLRESLWSLPALETMHQNWCIPEQRPIRLAGHWGGEGFVIEDLCDEDWRTMLPGSSGLMGYQRFQKNLRRMCPTACVH